MKTILTKFGIAMTAASLFSGCIKSVDPPAPQPAKTYISIMHLAPTGPSLDIFFNETKVSNNPFTPGYVTTAYNAVDKGAFSIKFKKAALDSLVAEVPTAQYDSLNYYTMFIYNLQADGPVQALRIEDDYSEVMANPTKLYYRFFHASPNVGAVDMYIDNVKTESGRMPADNSTHIVLSKFKETTHGVHNIQVKLAGTDTVIAFLNNAELSTGNAYTIYLQGLDGGTGTNLLSIGILRAAE